MFTLQAYLRLGEAVEIYTDASVHGLGGWLVVGGIAVGFFAVRITKFDLRFFGFRRGDNAGQQTWETLAILVALRLWRSHWQHVRARLAFHAGNVTALTARALMKAKHSTGVATGGQGAGTGDVRS